MATTTNYGWVTPDDTDLVKDGAAAIRTLGSSADTTTKNLNPETTLGDLSFRSSTVNVNTRLGIGGTGTVLTVAGGVPSWAAPAAAGSNFSLLNAGGTALTGADTITISGISQINSLYVLVKAASCVSASSTFNLIVNSNTSSIYYFFGSMSFTASPVDADILTASGGAADASQTIGKMPNAAGGTVSGTMLIQGCNSSGVKMFFVNGQGSATSTYTNRGRYGGGYIDTSSTISSISLVSTAGDFDSGTIFIYGSAV